ncbi:MAG: ABC transporter permease, partial [Rhodothermales bacterium]|nr:ABC transporter permease [Rhodothermales bacterium]
MFSSLLWRSSRRYLLRHPVLMGLSVLGVALGVAVVIGIDIANSSALKSFELASETVTGKATHQIVGTNDRIDEEVYSLIRTELGIRSSAPVVTGYAIIPGPAGRTIQVLGVDILAEEPFRSFTGSLRSDLDLGTFLSGQRTGVMSSSTAEALGFGEGDEMRLLIDGIDTRVSLIGLISPSEALTEASIENLLLVDVSTAQAMFGVAGKLSRIDLILTEENREEQISRLEEQLPTGVEIQKSESRSDTIE